jgi:hypothetical protein
MTKNEDIALLRAVRVKLAELHKKTPERNQSQRRFLGRFDRSVLIMIGHLNGNVLDANAYDSLASEFSNATGALKKLIENLKKITGSLQEANKIIDQVVSVFNEIPRPAD